MKAFLFNLNIVPFLFSAGDFNLFNCIFLSLTLGSCFFYNAVEISSEKFNPVSLIFSKIIKITYILLH